jgi:FkbM family methyltransferase
MQQTSIRSFLRNIRNRYEQFLSLLIFLLFSGLVKLPRGRQAATFALEKIFTQQLVLKDRRHSYKFHVPNWLTFFRAKTLFSKEPETIDWIRHFPPDSVFWDVGANVGTYSVFAGKNGARVFSIEPSFLNLEILQRNIILNDLNDSVSMIPIGLGSENQLASFYLSKENLTWGGAHNSLGKNLGAGGKALQEPLKIAGLCITMDEIASVFRIPKPNFVKIDVDGLELEVLKGGIEVLSDVTSVLIEVDDGFVGQDTEISSLLQSLGFDLEGTKDANHITPNQIWIRKK